MRIALISDIHGNYKAYEACMEYLDRNPVDLFYFLGDYITDCPYPQKLLTMFYDTLKNNRCYYVRGNREEYILENAKEDKGWQISSGTGTLLYTAKHLKKEDLAFFEGCDRVRRVKEPDFPSTTLCHGTVEDIRGNLGEHPELLTEALAQAETDYLLGGHSHKQEIRKGTGGIYINPGSLGIAIDGVGKRAQFAILEVEKKQYRTELLSIPYDYDGLMRDFGESGIEAYGKVQVKSVKKTLCTGINYFFECVKLATRLSGGMNTSRIPEKIWEQAAKELSIE